ncbi:hypothetical protein [Streptomyces sp. NPDC001537]
MSPTPQETPARGLTGMVDHVLEPAATSTHWDGNPAHVGGSASALTAEADLAPFTPADLDEARSRLTRLLRIWANRLDSLSGDQLDHSPGEGRRFVNSPCISRDRRTTPTRWAAPHDPAHSARR